MLAPLNIATAELWRHPFKVKIFGKQAHGAYPWLSVDPIVTSAQMIMGLQTIVSRELPLVQDAVVVTIGSIHGGVRSNIIPSEVNWWGLFARSTMPQEHMYEAIPRKVNAIAASMGATAEITLLLDYTYPVTFNDHKLMDQMLPTLWNAPQAETMH